MAPKLPLPRGWKRRVRSSVLHILALSHYTPIRTLNAFLGVLGRGQSGPSLGCPISLG